MFGHMSVQDKFVLTFARNIAIATVVLYTLVWMLVRSYQKGSWKMSDIGPLFLCSACISVGGSAQLAKAYRM